jgi:hypothetical protein
MSLPIAVVAIDAHAHLHARHRVDVALAAAVANLSRLAKGPAGVPARRALVMVDPAGTDGLARLVDGASGLGHRALATADPWCLTLDLDGRQLHLVAGRQLLTLERVEVLALGTPVPLDDGIPAAECLRAVRASGALAVLPWSPGKWLGARGRVVRALIDGAEPGELLVGDVAIRPRGLPEPPLLAHARRRGLASVAGSDPLPTAGEETRLGSYGVATLAPWDEARPGPALLALLASGPPVAGRRDSLVEAVVRLARHALRRGR